MTTRNEIQIQADEKADRAGEIKALMSDLNAELKEIKAFYREHNISEGNGYMYRATFSVADRIAEKWKELALSFNPSRQKLKAYETVTPVETFRVNARKL